MKKVLWVPLAAVLLLSGCGGGDGARGAEAEAMRIREELAAMTALTGQAEVTADYGERVYTFVLDIVYSAESGGTLTVVEPAIIAGVTATITEGGVSLEYAGASLETGPLPGTGASPIEAMPLLLLWARSGYLSESVFETLGEIETVRMVCTDPSQGAGVGTQANFWFDRETHAPLRAELLFDGAAVITCTFRGIELT